MSNKFFYVYLNLHVQTSNVDFMLNTYLGYIKPIKIGKFT